MNLSLSSSRKMISLQKKKSSVQTGAERQYPRDRPEDELPALEAGDDPSLTLRAKNPFSQKKSRAKMTEPRENGMNTASSAKMAEMFFAVKAATRSLMSAA